VGDVTITAGVMARLELSGLIRLARTDPQLEYLFRHALVHDAAYDSIARKDRRELHRTAGEILEDLSADRLDEVASTLAFHFDRAGLPDRAVGYQLRAAARAARDYANAEAIDHYRAALEGPAAGTLSGPLHGLAYERFGTVLELVGRLDDAVGAYQRALEHVDDGDIHGQARIHRRIGNAHRIARRVPEARSSFGTATARLDEVAADDRGSSWWSERIDLLLDRAWLHYFWGTFDEMRDVLDECAPALDRYATDAQRTRYHARRALHMARTNHMVMTDEILSEGRKAYDLWRAVGDPTDTELARFQLGLFHVMRGELEEARRHLNDSLAAAELTGDVVLQSRCFTYLALAARFGGDVDEMERIHERAMPAITAGGMAEYQAMIEANRCWAAHRRGDLKVAHSHASAALERGARSPVKDLLKPSVGLPLLAMALDDGDMEAAMEQAAELADASWTDEEYGEAIRTAIDAHGSGNAAAARQSLERALERAARIGWV
jgi:tetratricopeptide (TPR) repeat protein